VSAGGDLLVRDCVVAGRRADLRVRGGVVTEMGAALRRDTEPVMTAAGAAVLPGLHDHHAHLLALAAAWSSVRCGPDDVPDADAFAAALAAAPGSVRGVDYHERVAGPLDRHVLDRMLAQRPVRVQHRSGAAWFLNSAALAAHGLLDSADPAVERDAAGRATGRILRGDHLLRRDAAPPDLTPVGARLASYGVTGVTDATPKLDADTLAVLSEAALPQRVVLLGAPLHDGTSRGVPWKILLDESRDLDVEALTDEVRAAHAAGRPGATGCSRSAAARSAPPPPGTRR